MRPYSASTAPPALRFSAAGCLMCYPALAAALFLPALRRGVHLFGTDTVTQYYIFNALGFEQIRAGVMPLWFPRLFGGIPFLGSFAFCPFFPTTWPMALLPFHTAFTLQYLLSNALAGCGAYLCFRLMGFRSAAAFAGGIFFQLNCHFATLTYPGHFGKYPAIACFPLVFGAIHSGLLCAKPRMLLLAAGGLALQLFASHPQIYYYTAVVIIAYAAFHFLFFREHRTRRFLLRAALLLAGSLGLSILLAAIFFLPAYEMSRLSNRSGGLEFAEAAQSSYPPAELLELIFPLYTGDSIIDPLQESRREPPHGTYFGQWGERLVSDYLGIGILLLAVFGLIFRFNRRKLFWLAVMLAALMLCTGRHNPLYALLFRILPGLDHFRSPATIMFLIPFAAIVLALDTLEQLFASEHPRGKFRSAPILALPPLFLIAALAVLRLQQGVDPAVQLREVLALNSFLRTSCVGLIAALSFAAAWFARSVPARNLSIAALVLVSALDLFMVDRNFIRGARVENIDQASAQYRNFAAFLNLKQEARRPFRLLDLDNHLTNWPAMAGLHSLHGYHPVSYRKYHELIAAHGYTHPTTMRLLYLRLLLTRDPRRAEPANFTPLPPGRFGELFAFQADSPLDYAWFPQTVQAAPDEQRLPREMFEHNPYQTVFAAQGDQTLEFGPPAGCAAQLSAYEFNRVQIELAADRRRPLVVAEYAAPGWRAFLDREHELPIRAADYFFRIIEVPPGRHQLEFRYEPDSYRAGGYLSLITLGVIAGWLGFARRRRPGPYV